MTHAQVCVILWLGVCFRSQTFEDEEEALDIDKIRAMIGEEA